MDPQSLELFIPLTAIVMGSLMFLIPIAGITARIALKPVVEAIARYREMQGSDREVHVLEQRVALLEQQLQAMEGTVQRIAEVKDFDRRLAAPRVDAGLNQG